MSRPDSASNSLPQLWELPSSGTVEETWRSASRSELLLLGAYFFVLVVLADAVNVRLGIEAMSVAVVLAALGITRSLRLFWYDWWFFLAGLVLWNLSGPIAAGSPFPVHLDFMINFDRFLFLGHDPVVVVQHALSHPGHVGMLDIATALSYNLHVPEPYIVGYFLWRLDREMYLQFAAAVLLVLLIGFGIFIVFPAIPPWMAATTFRRIPYVFNDFGPVLRHHPLPFHGTPIFYVFNLRGDAVAAFPSEHAALPMLEYLALARIAPRVSLLLLGWVLWILFCILYLGEHWVTDAIAGWLLALFAFVVVRHTARKAANGCL